MSKRELVDATILIDEPATVCSALPVLLRSFHAFMKKELLQFFASATAPL